MLAKSSTARIPPATPSILTRRGLCLAFALVFLTLFAPAWANDATTHRLRFENDFFVLGDNTDEFYTQGFRYTRVNPKRDLPLWLKWALGQMPVKRLRKRDALTTEFGTSFGQNIYTPQDISLVSAQPGDRPWGGYLYRGWMASVFDDDRLDSLEVQLGVVGDVSGAAWVQTGWHELLNLTPPEGWDNQLESELAFSVQYSRKSRHELSRTVDVIRHCRLLVGTVQVSGAYGGTLRVGRNKSGFGYDRISPAIVDDRKIAISGRGTGGREYYGFVGAEARLVAHNVFLDGNVFRTGPDSTIDRKPFVYDLSIGVTAQLARSLVVTYEFVRRSGEFDPVDKAHEYGSLSFSFRNRHN